MSPTPPIARAREMARNLTPQRKTVYALRAGSFSLEQSTGKGNGLFCFVPDPRQAARRPSGAKPAVPGGCSETSEVVA
jgi:hypothetical protein